ncbi:YkgJ family cysteine cluster protein [Magnetospirillum sulfuroxidans]|uniref:YkgJ family cysteine cluster protein n=1 Tax=Magnetospirillum sulfuroxidans TaxID=611300 RepID=A0ABS5ICL3_9PROT|nr:YkgJ family cysteine cluster protein [Magnetospirillum sulfuroxidans]MBR9972161.1 YkgJ family cysteine cluster protein [Magnetospirillum sulfuroxidans]
MSPTNFDPVATLRGQARRPPPPLEQAAFDAAHAAVSQALPQGVEAMMDAVTKAWQRADRIFDSIRQTPAFALGQAPAACRRGCGWCCHQKVGAAAIEILAMSRALATRPAERALLTAWRPDQPCAFLQQGACAVYDIRPLKCRSLWHVDVRHCMTKYAGLPVMAGQTNPAFQLEPKMIYEGALKGLALPLIKAGRDCPGLELMPALQAIIDRPDAAGRWWDGETVFPAAAVLDWFPKVAVKSRRRR